VVAIETSGDWLVVVTWAYPAFALAYLMTNFRELPGVGRQLQNLRVSTGIQFRF
jgi:hypothetical protein